MSKNYLEAVSRIALFRGKETEPGAPSSSGGVSMALESGSFLLSAPAAVHDGDLIRGAELPTAIAAGPRECAGNLAQKRAKPDFLAFILAYFFGACSSAEAAAGAYRHTITPASGLELPSFTLVQRMGANVFTERLAGNYLEALKLELDDGWVSASAEVMGTGHREANYEREVVTAPADASSIELAANGVAGDDAIARLRNVYRVRARDAGSQAWQRLAVSAVSADFPAVISFSAPLGMSTNGVDYIVDYLPVEPAWCEFPDFLDESPLRLTDARVLADAYWDGSEFLGGEDISAEVMGFSISMKNNLELRRYPGATGPAAQALRGAREITIALTEPLKNSIRAYQADHPDTETLSLALTLAGAEIAAGSGVRFGAELIFPRCGILHAPVKASGARLSRDCELAVMDDAVYGGAVVRCCNQIDSYL